MGESKWEGCLLGAIGINLLMILITACTLGIGAPWALCMKERWVASHTVLDGKRLRFDGQGGELFVTYLKWYLFTVITIGIYGFFVPTKLKQWKVSNTHLS